MSGLTCKDARRLFDAHLNDEISVSLETELNAHRLRCPACRHDLAVLEVAGDVIGADDGPPALDAEFTDRLLACVCEQRSPERLRRRRMVRIGARALAAAACIALALIYFDRPASQRAPRVAGQRYRASNAPDARAAPRRARPEGSTFQQELEQALTEWGKDASSLQKMYHFITPRIKEEMRLERSESVSDQSDRFKPHGRETPPQGSVVPARPVEDI